MSDGDDELVLDEGDQRVSVPDGGLDGDDAVGAATDDLLDGDDDGFDDEYADDEDGGDDGDDDEGEDEDEGEQVAAPLDAVGDDDDEQAVEPAVDIALLDGLQEDDVEVDEDDDGDGEEEDGLAAGEFVCRSCHMAKRPSALADPDGMLCRDCV